MVAEHWERKLVRSWLTLENMVGSKKVPCLQNSLNHCHSAWHAPLSAGGNFSIVISREWEGAGVKREKETMNNALSARNAVHGKATRRVYNTERVRKDDERYYFILVKSGIDWSQLQLSLNKFYVATCPMNDPQKWSLTNWSVCSSLDVK